MWAWPGGAGAGAVWKMGGGDSRDADGGADGSGLKSIFGVDPCEAE